jgi:hypothetical protein
VGQVVNLRPIVNRPGARPLKLLGHCRQASIHRIHLDVTSNAPNLRLIANQSIVALVLPEWLPSGAQDLVALPRCESLERLRQLGHLHEWSDQEVNVVAHDDITVEMVVFQMLVSIVNGLHDHIRDLRPAKMERASGCVVEKAVHRKERLSGGACSGEAAIHRKAAMQAPGEEDRLADRMIMREATRMEAGHEQNVADSEKILWKVAGPIANRLQVANLPHMLAKVAKIS